MEIRDLERLFERVALLEVNVGRLKDRAAKADDAIVRLGARVDELDQEAPDEPASTWFVVDEDGETLSRKGFAGCSLSFEYAMKFFNEEDAARLLNALKDAGMVGLSLKEVLR